jgi:copper chaperone NosL
MVMTRRRFLYAAGAGAAAAAAAPAIWALLGRPAESVGPPAIRYGHDRCDACGMIISDPRYAAAVRQGATTYRYDDIGCLLAHSGKTLFGRKSTGYVHDADSHDWLEAGSAAFVRSAAIRTPMGYGLAAYRTPEAARRAHPGVAVMAFEALVAHAAEEGR